MTHAVQQTETTHSLLTKNRFFKVKSPFSMEHNTLQPMSIYVPLRVPKAERYTSERKAEKPRLSDQGLHHTMQQRNTNIPSPLHSGLSNC